MEDELPVVEELPQEELLVEELKCSNAALLVENDLLERFISRLEPHELVSQQDGAEDPGAAGGGGGGGGASLVESGGCGRRRRSRSHASDRLQQLTPEQKLFVARREVRETQQDHDNIKQRYERIQDNYKASLKESEMRLAEVRKAKAEFERRLLRRLKDDRAEMKEPEKVLQCIRDKLQVAQLEKLHLKNQALKVQEKKLQQQLRHKKETGKAEYEDIFQEYNEQRLDKNRDELQVNSLKVQRVLGSHKEKLQSATSELTELSNDIASREQMLLKIEEAMHHAEEERLKAEALNRRLRRQMTEYEAPDISEYIEVKEKQKKLEQSIHTWERKVGIAEMALRTHTTARSKRGVTLTPANSAAARARSGEERVPVKLPNITEHN